MGRILAFDYGNKRVGIAVTDTERIIATALTTVHSAKVIDFVKEYMKKEEVDIFVVGDARKLDNSPTDSTKHIKAFVNRLKNVFPGKKIEKVDERFTSQIAKETMLKGGLKKKKRRDKELVDKISATIILQTYMSGK